VCCLVGDFQQSHRIAELLELRRVMGRGAGALEQWAKRAQARLSVGSALRLVEMDLAVRLLRAGCPTEIVVFKSSWCSHCKRFSAYWPAASMRMCRCRLGMFAREPVKGVLELLIARGGLGEVKGLGSGPFSSSRKET